MWLAADNKDRVKEASLTACRGAVESCVVTVELLGRDFPSCLDYGSLRAIVRAMRDAADIIASSLKILSAEGKVARWIGSEFCCAVEQFKKMHAQLPQALADLEKRAEDSRPMTQHLDAIKSRMLSLLPSDASGLTAQPSAQRVQRDHQAAESQFAAAQAEAEASWGQVLLQRGLELRARTKTLTDRMDYMLAPFIRISHSIKGKGDQERIGASALTAEELQAIHKYTAVLLQNDVYQRLEDDGASIEDFLEALFLLGIAGGVGMEEGEAKQSASALGFSRKSLALLSEALASLDADGLRVSYTAWKQAKTELSAVEADPAFQVQQQNAEAAAAAYVEAAEELDRVGKEMVRAEEVRQQTWHTCVALQSAWLNEFGEDLVVRAQS